MAGLFFCLASANGAGLLFCPAAIQPHTSAFTTAFISSMQLYRPRRKTAHGALQKLFRLFAAFFRCCVAVYPAILHHLRHAGAYHSAAAPPAHTGYQRSAGRCTGQRIPPIIIMYIRVRTPQTMPARRGQLLPCVDRWQVLHPAHLLRGQRLHLYRVSPAACNLAPGQRSERGGSV